jgi:hypothetical protein
VNLDNPTFVPAPEVSVVTGDIFPPTIGGDPSPQPTEPPPAAAAQPQRIVVGDRVFNTTEEALAYADGFAQSQTKLSQQAVPIVPVAAPKTINIGTRIFEEPEQVLAERDEAILERVRSEQRVIEENKKFWDDFKRTNPDLVGNELVVDAVLAREQSMGTLRNMTRDQAAPILAAKARLELSKIRNVQSGGQALPSNPAMVAGSSGASAPRVQAPQQAPTNFVGELRGMRKRA